MHAQKMPDEPESRMVSDVLWEFLLLQIRRSVHSEG